MYSYFCSPTLSVIVSLLPYHVLVSLFLSVTVLLLLYHVLVSLFSDALHDCTPDQPCICISVILPCP